MTSKILLIKGKGGLGNRILSAVCGLVFADLTGRHPVIDWRDGIYAPDGENAYPLLFDSPIPLDCKTFDDVRSDISPTVWSGRLTQSPQQMIETFSPRGHSNPTGYRRFCTDLATLGTAEQIAVYWSYLPKFGRLSRFMAGDPRFAGRNLDTVISDYLDRYFRPNARVSTALGNLHSQITGPSIGVHIRYTDRKVPLAPIRRALRNRLRRTPDAQVFLASDNAQVQADMAAAFDGIIHFPKHLPKDGVRLHSPTARIAKQREAENALVDMWQLGRCDHLICSRHSTFSVTSAYLGRMTPDRVTDVDRYSPSVVLKRVIQSYI